MCILFSVLAVPVFAADQQAVNFDSVGTLLPAGNYYSLGWQFDTNQDFYVTSVGYFDPSPATDLPNSVPIGFFNSSGDLLKLPLMNVAANAAVDGLFRYTDLATPFLLPAGNNYVIAATNRGAEYGYNPANFSTAPGINFDGGRYGTLNPFYNEPAYPPTSGTAFYGPNFKIRAVPEPVSCTLFLLGGGALAAIRRKKTAL
jgi:hypothetical protein